jgi:hypothetical protein
MANSIIMNTGAARDAMDERTIAGECTTYVQDWGTAWTLSNPNQDNDYYVSLA